MEALMENVLALEREADELIEKAHHSAREIKSSAEEELRTYREQLTKEREQRLKDLEQAVKDRFQHAAEEQETQTREALNTIAAIPQGRIEAQIGLILFRFKEG